MRWWFRATLCPGFRPNSEVDERTRHAVLLERPAGTYPHTASQIRWREKSLSKEIPDGLSLRQDPLHGQSQVGQWQRDNPRKRARLARPASNPQLMRDTHNAVVTFFKTTFDQEKKACYKAPEVIRGARNGTSNSSEQTHQTSLRNLNE